MRYDFAVFLRVELGHELLAQHRPVSQFISGKKSGGGHSQTAPAEVRLEEPLTAQPCVSSGICGADVGDASAPAARGLAASAEGAAE